MSRPKRKAATNKSYNDTIDYSAFEEPSKKQKQAGSDKSKRNSQTSISSSNEIANGIKSDSTGSTETEYIRKLMNWQPEPKPIDYFSNKLNLTNAYLELESKTLYCPNQQSIPMDYDDTYKRTKKFKLSKGDFIYMISEPPGEPYYIGRIMGFKSSEKVSDESVKIVPAADLKSYQFQVQWFYRPRDISKSSTDSRLLFASMHTDTCPLISFRGIVNVQHKQDIENFDEFTKKPNSFYFDKLYDRYMMKFYDVLSTSYLMKIGKNEKSKNFLIALNKRFQYIFIEPTITKFIVNGFVSNSCTCETCGQWCSNQDSVNCAECSKFYHMSCLDPPLLKKPSRGFSWHCVSCTNRHLREYKNNRILMLGHDNKSSNELDLLNDIRELESTGSPEIEEATTSQESDILPKYELMAIDFLNADQGLTFEQRRLQEEWCMRYLGTHSKLEDGVDLDDRSPYPRASTGIGAKHQVTHIPEYIDHPIVYYDAKTPVATTKKQKTKPIETLKPMPVPKEFEDIDSKEYPSWLQPRPKGYIERGVDDGEEDDEDRTCTLLWKPLDSDFKDNFSNLDRYVDMCTPLAEGIELSANSPNFVDKILLNYYKSQGDIPKAMNESVKITKQSLNEPILTKNEIELFEKGVKQFGSELYPVFKMVKTVPCASIVRFYYLWKKTNNGKRIWGNFEGRIKKKLQNLQNENKDTQVGLFKNDDDSSYETKKLTDKHFLCKHCETESSTQWFRLTGQDKTISKDVLGLCFRCARLWRRYAIVWQDPNEIERRISKGGLKRIDYEVMRDFDDISKEEKKNGGNGSVGGEIKTKKRASPSPTLSSPAKKKKPAPKPAAKPVGTTKVKQEPSDKPKTNSTKSDAKHKMVTLKLEKANKTKSEPTSSESTPPPLEPYETDHLINPILNTGDYKIPEPLITALGKTTDAIDAQKVEQLSSNFRIKQLCDLSRLINDDSSVEPKTDTTNCAVCNDSTYTEFDYLNCGACGITVHLSCIGNSMPSGIKQRPDWLCECCVNDMHPRFELDYKCCLCHKDGGYLKPVLDSGKWAHFVCCLVNYKSLEVQGGASIDPSKAKKYMTAIASTDDKFVQNKLLIESLSNTVDIKNASRIFVENRKQICNGCKLSGSLIKCEFCDDYYHVTCSGQIKFKFNNKESKMRINNKAGKVEPALICQNHPDAIPEEYLELNFAAKRNQSSKVQSTIMQLFLEDLLKTNTSKMSGNHFKAVNYLRLIKGYLDEEEPQPIKSTKSCSECGGVNSPIWRKKENHHICQNCYHKSKETTPDDSSEDSTITAQEFLNIINEPITGEQFGIRDHNDRVTNIHKPLNIKELMNH